MILTILVVFFGTLVAILGGFSYYLADHLREANLHHTTLREFISRKEAEYKTHLEHKAQEIVELQQEIVKVKEALEQEKQRNDLVISQKKSSETRTGAILETVTPILTLFEEYNLKDIRWLGSPIDFVAFELEGPEPRIVFLECKSGGAKESKRQRIIKNLIKSGRVFYEQIRIDQKGVSSKREENLE